MTLLIPNQSLKLTLKNWYLNRVVTTLVIMMGLTQVTTMAAPRTSVAAKAMKVIINVLCPYMSFSPDTLQVMTGTNWKGRPPSVSIIPDIKQLLCAS